MDATADATATTPELDRGGYVAAIDTERLGWAVIELGGGRKIMTDAVDHSVGLEMLVRIGDHVESSGPVVSVFSRTADFEHVQEMIRGAVPPLI